jgi:hypothetical protein
MVQSSLLPPLGTLRGKVQKVIIEVTTYARHPPWGLRDSEI